MKTTPTQRSTWIGSRPISWSREVQTTLLSLRAEFFQPHLFTRVAASPCQVRPDGLTFIRSPPQEHQTHTIRYPLALRTGTIRYLPALRTGTIRYPPALQTPIIQFRLDLLTPTIRFRPLLLGSLTIRCRPLTLGTFIIRPDLRPGRTPTQGLPTGFISNPAFFRMRFLNNWNEVRR